MSTTLTLFPKSEGHLLAIQGANRAADKAERDSPGWGEQAWRLFQQWLSEHREPFQTEDFRAFAYSKGLSQPKNQRAFGGLIIRAKNEGLIRSIGYAPVSNKKCHATPAAVWLKV